MILFILKLLSGNALDILAEILFIPGKMKIRAIKKNKKSFKKVSVLVIVETM
jgi:hypothetical protein